MNRADLLKDMIEKGDNKVTCGFLWAGKDSLAVKTTQACSELREKLAPQGLTVVFHRMPVPSDSWYSIERLEISAYFDPIDKQGEFADFWK